MAPGRSLTAPLRWGVVTADLGGTALYALVVSYEPFHRAGLVTVCPITATHRGARHPGDVALPADEAGQPRDVVVVTSQLRTISQDRINPEIVGCVTDPTSRRQVRRALAHHLGLDIPGVADGA